MLHPMSARSAAVSAHARLNVAKGISRRMKTSVRVIIVEEEPEMKNQSFRRTVTALGFALGGSGLAFLAYTGRPSRIGLGLLGSGLALTLAASPQLLTANVISGAVMGTTVALLGPFYLHDTLEMEVQRIFEEARHLLPFPEGTIFDDSGPIDHAVSRPRYEVLCGTASSLLTLQHEKIKVQVAGYIVTPVGSVVPIVGYAYASRTYPWERFVIDKADMALTQKLG